MSCAFVIPVPNTFLPKRVSFKKDHLPTVEVSLDEPEQPEQPENEHEDEVENDQLVKVSWYERFNISKLFWRIKVFLLYGCIIILANIIARFYKQY